MASNNPGLNCSSASCQSLTQLDRCNPALHWLSKEAHWHCLSPVSRRDSEGRSTWCQPCRTWPCKDGEQQQTESYLLAWQWHNNTEDATANLIVSPCRHAINNMEIIWSPCSLREESTEKNKTRLLLKNTDDSSAEHHFLSLKIISMLLGRQVSANVSPVSSLLLRLNINPR